MHEADFSYLGQCLKDARKRCGLTQQELADQSGVGLRHIQNIENGTVNPSYECLAYLIEYSCAGVPLFRRNGYRQSSGRKPLIRNRDTTLN